MMKKILMFVLVLGGQVFAAAGQKYTSDQYMNAAFDAISDGDVYTNLNQGRSINSARLLGLVEHMKTDDVVQSDLLQRIKLLLAMHNKRRAPRPPVGHPSPAPDPFPSPSAPVARYEPGVLMNAAFEELAVEGIYKYVTENGARPLNDLRNVNVLHRIEGSIVTNVRERLKRVSSSPAPAPSVGGGVHATFNYPIADLASKYAWVRSQVLQHDGRGGGNFANGSDEVYLPNSISSGGGVGSSSESSGASGEGFAAWANANRVPWLASVDGALAQIRVGEIDKPSLQDEFNTQLKARLGVGVDTFEQGLRNHHLNDISDPVQRAYLQRYKDSLR